MAGPVDLDRLIEEGLSLYGRGDLDAALDVWERVLAVDPGNEQANSYVEYVRSNYDVLTADVESESEAPFGIAGDDEPEYVIEISEGELGPHDRATPPMYMDPMDVGWMIEDEPYASISTGSSFDDARTGDEPLTLELEADEPPEPEPRDRPTPTPVPRAITANPDANFDGDTREYEGPRGGRRAARGNDFAAPEAPTGDFGPEATPGFGSSQQTDVKRRDLGFVKPRQEPPELKMTLRTPGAAPASDYPRHAHEDPTKESQLQDRASAFERSYAAAEPEMERASEPWRGEIDLPSGEHPPVAPIEPDDLIASLPSPKPAHITRDLPPPTVKPATVPPPSKEVDPHTLPTQPIQVIQPRRATAVQAAIDSIDLEAPLDDDAAPVSPTAPTRDLVPDNLHISFTTPAPQPQPQKDTRDFSEKPTKETPWPRQVDNPLISAPTRELGIRPPTAPPASRTPTEDEPTKMTTRPVRDLEGTKNDIVLPFDPIDARATQILEEIDDAAPAEEAKEDRTRRRITTLLERATLWSSVDLERAVAAVDLALGEDPNSALAQKLIHRNRDAIMNVFQAYMGDLDRQPVLARPLHELASAPISPRAAFLLSRVDGSLTLDEILDVSGMPRLEAYRYLAQLFLRGILR